MDDRLKAIQKVKTDAFYPEIGRASVRWSMIESGLVQWFARLTAMDLEKARAIFYSTSGFDGRRRMLLATLDAMNAQPLITPYIRLLIDKAGNYAGSRNKFAHGDLIFVGVEGSKHYENCILLDGREPWGVTDPPDAKVLTFEGLEAINANFGFLAAFIVDSLNWKGDPALSPARWTRLVEALPNPAHSGRLDRTIEAQIQLGPPVLSFAR